MTYINYMEKMIEDILDKLIEDYPKYKGIEPFRNEVIALALNKSEPLYSTSDLGHAVIEAKMADPGYRSKIISIIIEAIEKVRENPK
ncbi:MAG: late competence development ComFB family protein [candidate division WOR-3 bacterium]|nr:late competence development ComFB family protein [candidate division WOR-3 bacterium]